MSQLSLSTVMKVLKDTGLSLRVDEIPAAQLITRITATAGAAAAERAQPAHPYVHTPFHWPSNDEAVVAHVQSQLAAVGVDLSRFKVVDTHHHPHLLDTEIEIAHVALNGGTDAVVVPKKTSVEFGLPFQTVGQFLTHCVVLRCVAMSALIATGTGEGVGELLGATDWSHHPVLLVVTDLEANYHLYWLDEEGWRTTRNL